MKTTQIALRPLIDSAMRALASAKTSAEVLDARHKATAAYDAAKSAMRLAKAAKATEEILDHVRCAQGDALRIEVAAKIRLAEEYDSAQKAGETAKPGRPKKVRSPDLLKPTLADAGLTKQQVDEARDLAAAEKEKPGTIDKAIDEQLDKREEPTRAHIRETINAVVFGKEKKAKKASNRNPYFKPNPIRDALGKVTSGCRDILEVMQKHSVKTLSGAFIDDGDREEKMGLIKTARDALTWFLQGQETGHEK